LLIKSLYMSEKVKFTILMFQLSDQRLFLRILIFLSLFPPIFIMIFNPFGIISMHSLVTYFAILGYGIIGAGISYFFVQLCKTRCSKYLQSKNAFGLIITGGTYLLILTIGNFIYNNLLANFENLSWLIFLYMFIKTSLIAILPLCFIGFWLYNRKLKGAVNQNSNNIQNKLLHIISDNNRDRLSLPYEDLYYIKKEDNYVLVHFGRSSKLEKRMIRSTLTKIERMIQSPNIRRCHNSFIVNLDKVREVKKNASGMRLRLEQVDRELRVSKKFVSKIGQYLDNENQSTAPL